MSLHAGYPKLKIDQFKNPIPTAPMDLHVQMEVADQAQIAASVTMRGARVPQTNMAVPMTHATISKSDSNHPSVFEKWRITCQHLEDNL
ncbi:MAG TPA: hypothetical protein PK361_02540 [Chiayiivirga sp.]|nr:hypothetical protein [Chiayiivirga sp.]